MPTIKKPPEVKADKFKSAKWNELTRGRTFPPSAAPVLAILCQWYKVMHEFGGGTVYENQVGDIKSLPQIATIKTASAEIRQLNKQLGIDDGGEAVGKQSGASVLTLVAGKRADRRSRATG